MKSQIVHMKVCNQSAHDTWMGNRRFATYIANSTRNEKISRKAEIVFANPSTIALLYPFIAIGEITARNASQCEARSDQAASTTGLNRERVWASHHTRGVPTISRTITVTVASCTLIHSAFRSRSVRAPLVLSPRCPVTSTRTHTVR